MPPLSIEVWSDVVCPWCYVGKRRIEKALEQFDHRDEVELRWRSFELDPHAPPERPPRESANDRMTELAASEGLEYHLDRARGANSFAAHRLIQRALEERRQDAMKERLMRAHFTEGASIGDPETLVKLAAEIGIQGRAALREQRYADAVRADEELAARIGIRGVPYFVLGRRYGVSGAQPSELLLQALEKAWEAQVAA